MKRIFTFSFLLMLGLAVQAQDEHELVVPPTSAGILDSTIIADTTATGERADQDRVYVLQRGAPYLINQTLNVEGYHLRIKSEAGDGTRPLLLMSSAGGEIPAQVFRLRDGGHLTLEGLQISGRDILGNGISRTVRVSGNGSKVVVDDCVFDETSQAGFRIDSDSVKIFMSNSIVERMGELTSLDNGRFIDLRGNSIDSLWVNNCVLYDITSKIFRSAGGSMNFAQINQSTFFGSGQEGFEMPATNEFIFTNNIVANPAYAGYTVEQTYAMTMDTIRGGDYIDISYNNIFTNPEFEDALPAVDELGDTVKSVSGAYFGPQLSDVIAASASNTTNIKEVLTFANAPAVQTDLIATEHDTTTVVGDWDFSGLSPDEAYSAIGGQGFDRYTVFHDFSYDEGSTSYTAGSQGQPLGADLSNLGTAVKEDFFVRDNILFYPNPVRNQLFIQNLDKVQLSLIEIYDINGVKVKQQKVRAETADFYLPDLTPGTYILTVIDAAGKVSSRQIIKN